MHGQSEFTSGDVDRASADGFAAAGWSCWLAKDRCDCVSGSTERM
jgi:hypothetical protein